MCYFTAEYSDEKISFQGYKTIHVHRSHRCDGLCFWFCCMIPRARRDFFPTIFLVSDIYYPMIFLVTLTSIRTERDTDNFCFIILARPRRITSPSTFVSSVTSPPLSRSLSDATSIQRARRMRRWLVVRSSPLQSTVSSRG